MNNYVDFENDRRISITDESKLLDSFKIIGVIGSGSQGDALKILINRNLFIGKKMRNNNSCLEKFEMDSIFIHSKDRRIDFARFCETMNLRIDEDHVDEWVRWVSKTTVHGFVKEKGDLFMLIPYIQTGSPRCNDVTAKMLYFCELLRVHRIAHCDIAVRNWLMTTSGPILIDFGASVKFDEFNMNPLPKDVTPTCFDLKNRPTISQCHDLKGFYLSMIELSKPNNGLDYNTIHSLDEGLLNHREFYQLVLRNFNINPIPLPNPIQTPRVPNIESDSKIDDSSVKHNFVLIDHLIDLNKSNSMYPDMEYLIRSGQVPKFKKDIENQFMTGSIATHCFGICCCLCLIGCPCFCSYFKGILRLQTDLNLPVIPQETLTWIREIFNSDRVPLN
jgi:hypothetical protein